MPSPLSFFNRLLPFATPGTPLVQDLLHLAAICGLLYYAPQLQDWMQHRRPGAVGLHPETEQNDDQPAPAGDRAVNGEDVAAENAEPVAPHNERDEAAADPIDHDGLDHDGLDPQPDDDVNDAPQAGPARAPHIPEARNVGAKKAKSLARRDQKRAYHEFQRSQGEAQRAREAEGGAEREAALADERSRRRAAEAALEAKKAKERELKRELDRREREEEIGRRELAVSLVRRELEGSKMCDLFKVAKQVGGDVDEEWVAKILNASGMIGRKGDVVTMVTGTGWAVRVSEADMATLYRAAVEQDRNTDDGRVGYDVLGGMLETIVGQPATI
ncbi:hypothetical protein LTR08_004083 [Meristemomyces frigidus]|nr:hypothetical protein LTR08_004083 [Meristemomyces frigidus]